MFVYFSNFTFKVILIKKYQIMFLTDITLTALPFSFPLPPLAPTNLTLVLPAVQSPSQLFLREFFSPPRGVDSLP